MIKLLAVLGFGFWGFLAHAQEASQPSFVTDAMLANVFTHDTRAPITNTNAPWSAIGKLMMPGGNSYCTATLISRYIILTAAHCLMSKGQFVKGDYEFYPRFANGTAGSNSSINYFWWGTTTPDKNRGQDWALGRLATPLGDTYGWMGVKSLTGPELLQNRHYYTGAYNGDLLSGNVATWEKDFTFVSYNSENGFLLHNGDTSRGSSGAAIFIFEDDANPETTDYVVALNVAEYRDNGDSTLIGIPFTPNHANIAVPSATFYPTFLQAKDSK
ncbi:MAG: trypsin-like serine peptidase [Bdellovibrionota bacterium]